MACASVSSESIVLMLDPATNTTRLCESLRMAIAQESFLSTLTSVGISDADTELTKTKDSG